MTYAWIEVYANGDLKEAAGVFDQVMDEVGEQMYSRYLESVLGKIKVLEILKDYKNMVEYLNDLLIKAPRFIPGLVEKVKAQVLIGNWDDIVESVQRVLLANNKNIEALRIWTFYSLAREASYDVAVEKLKDLKSALQQKEPKNAKLYIDIIKPIVRISGRKHQVLEVCLMIAQEAKKISPNNSQVLLEVGEILRLLGDFKAAIQTFNEATQLEEDNSQAINKIVWCKILQGMFAEASQQMEFLLEVEENSGRSAELAFIASLLKWRKDQDKKEALRLLEETLSLHIAASKQMSPSLEFYAKLNPDFLLEIAREHLQYLGLKPLSKTAKAPPYLVRVTKLLETITKQIPGIIEGHLLLAKSRFIANDHANASKFIAISLQLDPDCIDALILSALISLQAGQYASAQTTLEQALARSFTIRENPLFMLVKGQVEMKLKKFHDAIKTFEATMALPGIRSAGENKKTGVLGISVEDRGSVFANLAVAYAENGEIPKATRIMAEAIGEFAGTSVEVIVVLANSEIALKKGDIKQALNILNGIPSDSPSFKDAKIAQSEIYLNKMSNRRLYAKCFSDIVNSDESVENYLMFGEALMRIQEPEEAIKIYEKALRQKPDDLFLTKEIGRALVLTHDYQRAIQYYESAVRNDPKKTELLTDLAHLYLRLKDFQSANLILEQALKKEPNDINSMREAAQNYLLQAQVFLKSNKGGDSKILGPILEAANSLKNAGIIQKDLLASSRDMSNEQIEKERKNCSKIFFHLGQYFEQRERNYPQALAYYNESAQYDDMNITSILRAGYLFEKQGDFQKCIQYCNRVLRIDPSNEEAATLMAEIQLQASSVDEALETYKKLLENKSDQYNILSKLVLTLRRVNKLEFFEKLLKNAERKKSSEAGQAYCRGLFFRFKGQVREALEEFNKSRTDVVYGVPSLERMIDIYLNPDDDIPSGSVRLSTDNVTAAESLVEELISKSNTLKSLTLKALVQVAKGKKDSVEKGLELLTSIFENNQTYVPAMIAYTVAKQALNKDSDAKSMLRNFSKYPYTIEYAEEFEKGWLMLAQVFIDSDNKDSAVELLHRCLKFNQSCGKAKEMLGTIKESENKFNEASEFFQSAWKISKTASIGFRLAFSFMKAKKYVQAISISKEILSMYPDYPRIKSEILDKCRTLVRA
jgi:tetratricopeptide repeat protein 21B